MIQGKFAEQRIRAGLHSASYPFAEQFSEQAEGGKPGALPAFADFTCSLGMSGVEVSTSHLQGVNYDGIIHFKNYLQRKNMGLVLCFSETLDLCQPVSEQCLFQIAKQMRLAEILGAPLISLKASMAGERGSTERRNQFRHLIESLDCLLPVAEQTGVQIGLENDPSMFTGELDRIMQAVASPRFGLTLDLGEQIALSKQPFDTVLALAPYTVHVHFKNCRISQSTAKLSTMVCGVNEGILDLLKVTELLLATGKSFQFSVELGADDCRTADVLHSYANFLQHAFGQSAGVAA